MSRKHIIICGISVVLILVCVAVSWAAGWIEFFSPLWLAALVALVPFAFIAVTGISGLPSHTNAFSLITRCILFILAVLCLAEIQVVLRSEGLCVLYCLDHSASIPEEIAAKQLGYVNLTAQTKGKKDTAGIVIFGENSSVEIMPVKELKVDRIYSSIKKHHTDIQSALELATAAFPANTRKKIVLMTDGNENKGDLLEGVNFASSNQAEVDILPVSYDYEKEILVEKVHVPASVKENETFDLRVHVLSLEDCPAELSIYRNGVPVARDRMELKAGRNTYAVAMKITEPGFYVFTARVSAGADTVVENNEASGYVYIQGSSRILFVAPTELEVSHLARACREDNLEADIISPEEMPESLGMLQNHDCIVLANVAADELSESRQAMLQANVRDLGVGLVMVGGDKSFGAGGYEGTPIEEALPVTMDIRQKKINPKGALVLILHTCEFPDGNYWAKQISKKAIETVNSQDEVGVLLYGNGEEWLFDLRPAEDKKFMYGRIDQASPGDMPSFEPTIKMAYDALLKSDAMVKHVIIISDGDPARPQPQVVKDAAAAGITISTVIINPHSPRDEDVMKYLAYATGGRYYFAKDPSVLPKIFIKEAKVVKRSLIFNKEFKPLLVLSTEVTKGISGDEIPSLMAYVATTAKPRSLVPVVSDNENRDPVLAYWRYGLGKSAAFTSDATSNWGRHWLQWDKYNKIWTQIIRWAARRREQSTLGMHARMDGNKGKLIIDAVDPQGRFINFLKLNGRIVNPDNKGSMLDISQKAPGRYEADFETTSAGISIINIGYQNPQTGGQGFAAMGVSIPYSPEYGKLESNVPLLRQAAAAGGGRLLSGDPAKDNVFVSALPASTAFRSVWEHLLIAALAIFFLDVVLRRVIVTRADLAAGLGAVRSRLSFRRKFGAQDETMAALLERKKQAFQRVSRPAAVPQDFKKKLEQAAAGRQKPGDTAVLEEPAQVTRAETEKRKPAPEAKKAPGGKPGQDVPEEESYTGRLLKAKKRAKM